MAVCWAVVVLLGRPRSFVGARLVGSGRGGRADVHHRCAMCCGSGQRCGYVVVVE